MNGWREFVGRFFSPDIILLDHQMERPPLRTGINQLDAELDGGLRPGMNVVMAEPGVGKSALAIQIAVNVAMRGYNVLFESIEMGYQSCWARACSYATALVGTGLTPFKWSNTWQLAESYRDNLMEDPFYLASEWLRERAPGLAFWHESNELSQAVLAMHQAKDVGADLVLVDYIQSLTSPGTDYEQVKAASNALAQFSTEAKVPLVAISSINRAAAAQKRPDMHSASGAGAIEYDAESVTVLWLDPDHESDGETREVLLSVEKNRNGGNVTREPARLTYWPGLNFYGRK